MKLILLFNLPSCPAGRIFKQDDNGDFFHSMTTDEAIKGDLENYHFTKQEVANNKGWFLEKD